MNNKMIQDQTDIVDEIIEYMDWKINTACEN